MKSEKTWTKAATFKQKKKRLTFNETGRFTGFDEGNGWRSGPWECSKGHWVSNSIPVCPMCRPTRRD